jgi:hypothetical protein
VLTTIKEETAITPKGVKYETEVEADNDEK